jgi:hypothetical protein
VGVGVWVDGRRHTYPSVSDGVLFMFSLWLSNVQFYDTFEEFACLPKFRSI